MHSLLQATKQQLRQWTKPDNRALALDVVLDLTRSKSELLIENALLRRQLREATGFGEGRRFLIRNNAPRANAYCGRFIGSLRRKCLDHLIH